MSENETCSSAGSCTRESCEGCPSKNGGQTSFLEELNQYSTIKKVIGVVSGKGGVGKSFVTASLACAMSSPGVASSLAQTINARYRVSRSLVSSILLPYIIEDAAKFKADRIAKLSKILRACEENATQDEAVTALCEYVRQKIAKNNLPARLKDLSLSVDQLALAAEDAGQLDLMNTLPRSMTSDDMFDLLKLAF